ncbi:MAG: fused MFS/spermidine synthase [Dermabacter sp.]|nr:fused MFS/spermidine synthase [Dermabacter sp.]
MPEGLSVHEDQRVPGLRIEPDPLGVGWVMSLHGLEQSHVDLDEPWEVRHEYLRRIAAVLDSAWPVLAPISALHLGAGALTLPRYLHATRPGSAQVAVDHAPGLMEAVIARLPLPPGTALALRTGDAAAELRALAEAGRRFQAIVVDIFTGPEAPAHVACAEFYADALGTLTPDGLLLVNVGDDDGLAFLDAQVREFLVAAQTVPGSSPVVLGDAHGLSLRRAGNAVLVAGPRLRNEPEALMESWRRAGPHPAHVSLASAVLAGRG